MRRNIVHLIRGEAKEAHEALTRDLVDTLDAFPLHDRIPPHFTFKRWFDLDEEDVDSIRKILDDFADSHYASDYSLKGFGHFGTDVIYVDFIPSQQMSSDVLELMSMLKEAPRLEFDEFDNGKDFHATVAMGSLKPFDFEKTWEYLQEKKSLDFRMRFDNIAILKKSDDRWEVEQVWELRPRT